VPARRAWRLHIRRLHIRQASNRKIKEVTMKRKVHGEGNYEAAHRYDKRTRQHLRNADIEAEAREAAPRSPAEAAELERAEAAGKRHVKEEDPTLKSPSTPQRR
jgi:hypothetical protein